MPMHKMAKTDRMLAYALAGAAGFVDAAGFLSADRYFVSFMSGNTTRLGVELARGSAAALIAGGLLAGFVLGVALGAMVADRLDRRHKSGVIALCAALLLAGALAGSLGSTAGFLGLSVLAMGALNNVFRQRGEVALGVTYMTGALVRVGEGLAGWLAGTGRGRKGLLPSLLLWASLSLGGLIGALCFLRLGDVAPWLAAGWLALLALAARRSEAGAPQPS